MQIIVKTQTGKRMTFDVESTDTQETIKTMILEKEEIPKHQQNFIFAGKPLEDGLSLGEYGILDKSEILFVLRPRRAA